MAKYICLVCGELFDEPGKRQDLYETYECCPYCGQNEFEEDDEYGFAEVTYKMRQAELARM